MDLMEEELPKNFLLEWQHDTMVRLVHVARSVGNKIYKIKSKESNVTRICLCDGRIDGRTPES